MKKITAIILIVCTFCSVILCGCEKETEYINPYIKGQYQELVDSSVADFKENGMSYEIFLTSEKYDPFGDFLRWGTNYSYKESERMTFDENGVVMVKQGETMIYNPVTVAQFALHTHGRFLLGEKTQEDFLKIADKLIEMLEEDGSIRYYYDFPYYCDPENYFKSGWTSSMASGHVLSVCARAYNLTGDVKYAEAAKKTLEYYNVPIEEGGFKTTLAELSPDLKDYVIYEEYPHDPPTYTLNGFMYALIGIYDWSCVESPEQEKAKQMFNDGVKTLEVMLPYFDIGGFTAYDLSYITLKRKEPHIGVSYHREHTFFCKIFYDITGIATFNEFYERWSSYVK